MAENTEYIVTFKNRRGLGTRFYSLKSLRAFLAGKNKRLYTFAKLVKAYKRIAPPV